MAAVFVFLVGVALAVARPGDLADDGRDTPVAAVTTTTSTTEPVRASQTPTSTTSTTATTSPSPSSGLGASGAGAVDAQRNLATTGGPDLAAPALALLGAGLFVRRRLRTID